MRLNLGAVAAMAVGAFMACGSPPRPPAQEAMGTDAGSQSTSNSGCTVDADCPHGQVCDTSSRQCTTTSTGGTTGGGTTGGGTTGGGTTGSSGALCSPCQQDSDCGTGGFCIPDQDGHQYCGTACSSSTDCPSGAQCFQLVDQQMHPIGSACYPSSQTCSSSTGGGTTGGGKTGGGTTGGGTTGTGGLLCSSCQQDSACGSGGFCLSDSDGNGYCGTACSTDTDCPSGAQCFQITDQNNNPVGNACYPSSQTCIGYSGGGTTTGGGTTGGGTTGGGTTDGGTTGGGTTGGGTTGGGTSGSDPFVTVPLDGCPFLGFDAPVTIGSQTFQLDVDTGSTTTFVAASSCRTCGVSPEYSPSSGADTGQQTSSQYGSGSVQGEVYRDAVHVGNEMPTVNMYFSGITNQQQFFLNQSCSGTASQQGEGILGMGPLDLDTIGMNSSDAYFTDLVATAMGMKNVFSVNLCTQNGNMWFGGYDPSYASGTPAYTPLNAMDQNNPYWEVSISSIGIGTTTFSRSGDPNSVVDTGTGIFMMPSAAYSGVVQALSTNSGAAQIFGSGTLSSSFFAQGGCASPVNGATQAQIDAALPPLTITLPKVGGGTFTLSMPATQSYLTLMQGQYCGSIQDNSQAGMTIWGAPALRAYITIFDAANRQIGFAPQNSCK